jgi:hypothetical protein
MSKTFKDAVEDFKKAKSDLEKVMIAELMRKSFWITFFVAAIFVSYIAWILRR